MDDFKQVRRIFVKVKLARFNAAHIQNIVDNGKQMIRALVNLHKTVPDSIAIIQMRQRDRGQANDGIERRADFVAHAVQELLFRAIGRLCRRERFLQRFRLAFELFLLFQLQTSRFIDADKAGQDLFPRIGRLARHHELQLPIFDGAIYKHAEIDIISTPYRQPFTYNFSLRHFHELFAVIRMDKRVGNQP